MKKQINSTICHVRGFIQKDRGTTLCTKQLLREWTTAPLSIVNKISNVKYCIFCNTFFKYIHIQLEIARKLTWLHHSQWLMGSGRSIRSFQFSDCGTIMSPLQQPVAHMRSQQYPTTIQSIPNGQNPAFNFFPYLRSCFTQIYVSQ